MDLRKRNATEIFGHLAQRDKDVGDSLRVRSFQAGETVCEAEEMLKAVFLVASGRVQRTRPLFLLRRFAASCRRRRARRGG